VVKELAHEMGGVICNREVEPTSRIGGKDRKATRRREVKLKRISELHTQLRGSRGPREDVSKLNADVYG